MSAFSPKNLCHVVPKNISPVFEMFGDASKTLQRFQIRLGQSDCVILLKNVCAPPVVHR